MTFETILENAASLLNDTGQYQWSEDALLPYLKRAWLDLRLKSKELGIAASQEVSAVISIPTSKTTITSLDITDLGRPKVLFERAAGSSDLFQEMEELDWEPSLELTSELRYWVWREGEIKLLGCLVAREVKLRYIKNEIEISSKSTTIPAAYEDARAYLESRTAAIAAGLSGGNLDRAVVLDRDATIARDSFFNIQVKTKQSAAVARHKGYRR